MAITYGLLLEADFGQLETVGESWMSLYKVLDEQAANLVDLKSSDESAFGIANWDGMSGEAARERVRDLAVALDERSAAARRVSLVITVALEEFRAAQADLAEVVVEADRERVTVSDSGSVIPDTSRGTDNVYYADGLRSRIQAALDRATEADEELKAAVGMWAETFSETERLALAYDAADEANELQELIDSGASPEQINDWWNGLTEAERLGILEGNPGLIAGLDGIPTDTRDAANRDLLDAEIDRYSPHLDHDIAELEAQMAAMEEAGTDTRQVGRYQAPTEEYARLQEQLEALQAERDTRDSLAGLQEAIAGEASTGQEYFLLAFDTEDNGGAIVSIGNPDAATNTGIFVPGTFATLDNFPDESGALGRAEAMAEDAKRFGVAGEETAIIAWLDYDAPQSASPQDAWGQGDLLPEALPAERAEEGAVTLNRFIDGLDAAHDGDTTANTTIVGHSYGSRLVGETAQDASTGADQVILVASPGSGADHASELAVGEENVWVTMAEGDAIAPVATESVIHGRNPTHDSFGANVFTSEAMGDTGSEIHGGYWGADSKGRPNEARDNMALIITGQTDAVERVG